MKSFVRILDTETQTIFAAGSEGNNIVRMTLTNAETSSITLNVYKTYKDNDVHIIPKDSLLPGKATMIIEGDLYVMPFQSITCVTTGELHIDLNIE